MEKRVAYFFIITVLFLISYTYLISKFYPSQELPPPPSSIKNNNQESPLSEITLPQTGENLTRKIETDKFFVTVSLTGGYINKLYIKSYKEELNFYHIGFIPEYKDIQFNLVIPKNNTIVLENKALGIKKIWEFDGYKVDFKLLLPPRQIQMVLFSNLLSHNGLDQRYQEVFFRRTPQEMISRKPLRKIKKLFYPELNLVGARDRYFCFALFPQQSKKSFSSELNYKERRLQILIPINKEETVWSFYIGPQIHQELAKYDLEKIINYGFFHSIALWIIKLLHFLFSFTKNWGLSIILFSIFIYIILFPLTFKSSQGMKELREFQKAHKLEMEKIKEKYKNQPQKMQQATLELYKKYGVSPLKGCSSGCLPLFLQIPVIWALWSVLPRLVELKGEKFLWIKDLSLPDRTFHLPFSLPFLGEWINILPILTAIIMYIQMKFTNPEVDPEQASQQKIMGIIFPIIFGIIFYQFLSALLLYWLINSLLTCIAQWRIMKKQRC